VTPELGVIFDFITEGSLPENVRSLTLPSHLILLAISFLSPRYKHHTKNNRCYRANFRR
jgi:hypothetical protein